jgi:hypothetical protein
VLSVSGGPQEWTVICNGLAEDFLQAIQATRTELVEQSTATFEEIFHARVAGEASQTSN